jgi:hypothetical protein
MAERTADRERQRNMTAEPFEQLDQAARKSGDGKGGSAAKQAAMTALAGAVAAGLAGAAKAMLDRRGEDDTKDQAVAEPNDADEEPVQDEARGEDEDEQPRSETRDESDAGESDEAGSGTPQAQAQPEEPQSDDSRDDGSQGDVKGVSGRDARAVVEQARHELQELLAVEPERVSGFERTDGKWTVTLEVVDVRRIPESTDVLASYDVTLDDDRNLVSVAQTRRYRRSQVEEG